jgi:acetyl-CoA C-acetyltransferase
MLVGPAVRRVAIIGGLRIPFARAYTAYASASNQDMLTAALRGVVERFKLQGERLGDVAAGAVIKHSKDYNLVRESVLSSGLDPQTPGLDMQRACGTGLEAAIDIGNKIALGQIEVGIAGGVDSISDAPIVYPHSYQQLLLRSYRARGAWGRVSPWLDLRPKHFKPVLPAVIEPRTGLSMGQSTEIMAKRWQISRTDQDLLAYDSHLKAAAAWRSGFYDDLVIEYLGLKSDNNVRADTSLDKLGKLHPSFAADGTLTAGNSTPLTDGASAVLLATPEWAARRNLPVLAYLRYGKAWAVDFASGKEGLLMAPAYAVPAMLRDAGITLQEFDYYEIHEAFAAQVLCTLKAWESADYCRHVLGLPAPLGSIDRSRLNIKGGSVALGHPFAATGTRIVATLAKLLAADANAKRGLVSVCTAGGMGVTAIIERDMARRQRQAFGKTLSSDHRRGACRVWLGSARGGPRGFQQGA